MLLFNSISIKLHYHAIVWIHFSLTRLTATSNMPVSDSFDVFDFATTSLGLSQASQFELYRCRCYGAEQLVAIKARNNADSIE